MSENEGPLDVVSVAFAGVAGVAQIILTLNRKNLLSPEEAKDLIEGAVGMLPAPAQADARRTYRMLLPGLGL